VITARPILFGEMARLAGVKYGRCVLAIGALRASGLYRRIEDFDCWNPFDAVGPIREWVLLTYGEVPPLPFGSEIYLQCARN